MPKNPGWKERRCQRSILPSEAIRLQLQHVAKNYRLDFLVLLDTAGNVWAKAGPRPAKANLQTLLATTMLQANGHGFLHTELEGKPLVLKKFSLSTTTFHLAAMGKTNRCLPALAHASAGIERILSVLVPKSTSTKDQESSTSID